MIMGDNATFVEAAEAAAKAGSDLRDALVVAMTAMTGQIRDFVVTKIMPSDLPEAIPEGDSDDYNLNEGSSDDSGQHEADSPDSNIG